MQDIKVAILGGSGRTGLKVIEFALNKNFLIQALARNPDSIKFSHPNLTIIKGNVLDTAAIEKTISGCKAVISVLGHVKDTKTEFQTEAMKNIIRVMKVNNINRIISLTGNGIEMPDDIKSFSGRILTYIIRNIAPLRFLDGLHQSELLINSGLDFTLIRVPFLTNGKCKGKFKTGNVKVGFFNHISRCDVARFILHCIDKDIYIKDTPIISW